MSRAQTGTTASSRSIGTTPIITITICVPAPKSLHRKEFLKTPFVFKFMNSQNIEQSGGGGLMGKIYLIKLFLLIICFWRGENLNAVKQKRLM
ncbi:MAG: hypothetical protein A2358_01805 [Candidatus Staskawiczbacteria bacterium RIFOXYB1_FULL_37_44]|uniref:Uncharacterized protein n=1 Tax=Candidatus Staskawiczbacteria bacterium RIFOXYB1_FULL_37_44 TaxID=1802223 RepID=A0A1G2IW02_9BACT|nr:MAG: hypothetical protein A2358_01805 [Candidatus Staskawiczbacteria bacterium RIFOXYB1_FULL_37_44]OGZ87483.1 MAG: hypothetical protein A2444_02075 [Candidatus Staskawiczbacteria bacterium RIFOXYC2_FULL_37_19]